MPKFGTYPAATTLNDTDVIVILQSGQTKRIAVSDARSEFASGLGGDTNFVGSLKGALAGQPRGRGLFLGN